MFDRRGPDMTTGAGGRRGPATLVAAAAVLSLTISACGSSGDGDDATERPAVGLTSDTIKIGFSVSAPAEIATGAQGVDAVDEKAQAEVLVDYVNANGGIAGRTIEPVFSVHEAGGDAVAGLQADCAKFTQDDQVFAAYQTANTTNTSVQLVDCLAQAGSLFLADAQTDFGTDDFAANKPYVFAPGGFGTQRWSAYVDGLDQLDYFANGAKVGIISFDTPQSRSLVDTVAAAVKDKGVEVTDKQYITPFVDEAGFGKAGAEIANMVLRFKKAEIDHVVLLATFGTAGFVFPTAAEAQGYRPRYAFSTLEFPQAIAANVSPTQLKDAIGVGWDPGWDLDAAEAQKVDVAGQTACIEALDEGGVLPEERPAIRRAVGMCNALLFLQAGLDGLKDPTASALHEAIGKEGFEFESATTNSVSFDGGRYDGVASLHGMRFGDDCKCWQYDGDWFAAD